MTQSGMFFYIDKLVMHTIYATVRNEPYYERLSMWNHCGYLDRDILFLAKENQVKFITALVATTGYEMNND